MSSVSIMSSLIEEKKLNTLTELCDDIDNLIGFRVCLCQRPSGTPTTQPNGGLKCRLVEVMVFNSIHYKKCDPLKLLKRIRL